ncbi:DUF3265 domain-containing protein [Vibrio vulnificus]|nr:DUF3265 domain-containing protein [Vibrio vulnificus]EME0140547.1 DUF3265 domain-containing protein [Vibrio vulnificus]
MRSSGTWHAWHFQFALSLVVTVLCGSFCIACLRPLTRRYATQVNLGVQSFEVSPAIRFVLSANEHFYPKIRSLLKP